MPDKARRPRPTTLLPALRGFIPAVQTAGLYTLFGLIVGGMLFWWEHARNTGEQDFFGKILEHLGLGFWVAAIAVFFYEWGAAIKKTIDLAEWLAELLSAKADEALRVSLDVLLGGDAERPHLRNVATTFHGLVLAISALTKERTWANDRYVSFVSSFIERFAGKNAQNFSKLLVGGEQSFVMPKSAASIADDILAEQMMAMTKNDRYDVISDLLSWRENHLKRFQEETGAAIRQKNVVVRRVFNLVLMKEPLLDESEKLSVEECRSILQKHYVASTQWHRKKHWHGKKRKPGYEVRVLRMQDLSGVAELHKEDVRSSHFGIFRHVERSGMLRAKEEKGVRFRVGSHDLSTMWLCRDVDEIEKSVELFEAVWIAAEPLHEGLIDEIVEDLGK